MGTNRKKKKASEGPGEDEVIEEVLSEFYSKRKKKKRNDRHEERREGYTDSYYEEPLTESFLDRGIRKEISVKEKKEAWSDESFEEKPQEVRGARTKESGYRKFYSKASETKEENVELGKFSRKKTAKKKSFFSEKAEGIDDNNPFKRKRDRHKKVGKNKRSFFREVKKVASAEVKAVTSTKGELEKIGNTIDEEEAVSNVPIETSKMAINYMSAGMKAAVSLVVGVLSAIFGPMIAFIGSVFPIILIVVVIVIVVIIAFLLFVGSFLFAIISAFKAYDTEYENTSHMYKVVYEYATDFTKKVCKDIDDGVDIKYYIGTRIVSDPGDIEIDHERIYLLFLAKNEKASYEDISLELSEDEQEKSNLGELLDGNSNYEVIIKEMFDTIYSYEEAEDGKMEIHVMPMEEYWFNDETYIRYQSDNYQVFNKAVYDVDVEGSLKARKDLGLMSLKSVWELSEFTEK